MEDLYGWLIVLAGAIIGLLGAFLFTSERELRNKRREYEEFRANQTADTLHRPTEAQRSAGCINPATCASNASACCASSFNVFRTIIVTLC